MSSRDDGRLLSLTRRGFQRRLAGVLAAATVPAAFRGTARGSAARLADDAPGFLVRQADPPNLETPVARLDSYITPNDAFFVRSHFRIPEVADPEGWTLTLRSTEPGSAVLRLGMEELRGMESRTVTALLECSGNNRTKHDPPPSGVAWDRGAVGNAEWTGVPLARLIERLGGAGGARHAHLVSIDGDPANAAMPDFLRSVPIERALEPDTLVAYRMNGEALPREHGGPLRLVVPGWVGNHWIKWLSEIRLAAEEAPGKAMRDDYRVPERPLRPGDPIPAEIMKPVTRFLVKSLITTPTDGARTGGGPLTIAGHAWSGRAPIAKVEIEIDGDGRWRPARLVGPNHPRAWRRFELEWTPSGPGRHAIRSRATDGEGEVQPEKPDWNPRGYLWNGIQGIEVVVG